MNEIDNRDRKWIAAYYAVKQRCQAEAADHRRIIFGNITRDACLKKLRGLRPITPEERSRAMSLYRITNETTIRPLRQL
jgi:hypothetical protein